MYPFIHLTLASYAVMAFIGGFLTLFFTYFRIEKYEVQFTTLLCISALSAFGVLIGGKTLFIVTQIPTIARNFSFLNLISTILRSGVVFYGGLLGTLLFLAIYTKHSQYSRQAIFALIAPAIPLFHGFGRIGCFLAGCCYGIELNEPIRLLDSIVFYRLPIQLFETVFDFLIFIVLIIIEKKKTDSNTMKIYLVSYAVFRFVIEFFRGDEIRGVFLLSTSQWVSLCILAFYVYISFLKPKNDAIKSSGKEVSL